MEIRFKNNKLENSFTDDRLLVKTYGELAKKIKQRYGELKAADNLSVIAKIPVLRLHSHQGNKGFWSVDIHQNWRILFTIDQDPIPILENGGVDLKTIEIIKIESVEDPH